ncbi:hypothetical protein PTKIN_Ptkin01aG0054700 [Pterospermum kingtungense]
MVGSCCVLRDGDGAFVAAKSAAVHGSVLIPAVAEALGFQEALSWIKSLQLQSSVVESNALVVINAIKNNVNDNSVFGLVVFVFGERIR